MRLIDVTNLDNFTAHNYTWYIDEKVADSNSWYLHLKESNKEYQILLGYYKENGEFQTIVVSNRIKVPRDSVSDIIDEEWLDPNDNWDEIFKYSGGVSTPEELASITGTSMRIAARRMEFKMPDSYLFSEGLQKRKKAVK